MFKLCASIILFISGGDQLSLDYIQLLPKKFNLACALKIKFRILFLALKIKSTHISIVVS